jgi:hypothetical protein
VCVTVDREEAAGVERHCDEGVRRILTLRARVDLDRDVVLGAGIEDLLRVERRARPRAAGALDQPPGDVPEHVRLRIADRTEHSLRHLRRRHLQLAVHARDDDVEAFEQLRHLVEGAVVEDVHLDAGQHAEVVGRRIVERLDDLELVAQPLRRQAVRDAEVR